MLDNASKCQDMLVNASKCQDMLVNASKCQDMLVNARVWRHHMPVMSINTSVHIHFTLELQKFC